MLKRRNLNFKTKDFIMKKTILFLFVVFLASFVCVSAETSPSLPVYYWGYVNIDSSRAGDGAVVSVVVDDLQVASAIVPSGSAPSGSGYYHIRVPLGYANMVAIFKVNGVVSKSITIGSVDSSMRLDLSITTSQTSCEDWSCTEWSKCINDTQTRNCTDLNECGTINNKPDEAKNCTVEEGENETIICVENEKKCEGDDLMECLNNQWKKIKTCENGCLNGECIKPSWNETPTQPLPSPPFSISMIYIVIVLAVIIIGSFIVIKWVSSFP